jgi:TonB family protein
MRNLVPVCALCVLALPTHVDAAPVVPTDKWVVNFDDAQCVASRAYGEDKLFLKASPLGDVVQFGIMEPGRSGPPQQVPAEIRPVSGEAFKGNAVLWSTGGKAPQRIRLINMPAAEFQRLSASPALELRIDDLKQQYAVPAMTAMAKVMKECVDDLQRVWTSDGGVSARSTANLATYFKDDDYPEVAIRDSLSGTTVFALLITEEGRVADCMVVQTSGQAILDTQSCAIIKRRARFEPARDHADKPVKDRVTARIVWRIP